MPEQLINKSIVPKNCLSAVGIGVLLGMTILYANTLSQKWMVAILGGLLGGIVLILARKWQEEILLFSLVFIASISIDVHFFLFENHVGGAYSLSVSLYSIFLFLLVMQWCFNIYYYKIKVHFIPWISIPFMGYLFVSALSLLKAPEPLLGIFQIILFLQAYVAFLYLSNRLRSEKDYVIILYAILLALFVQSVLALLQQYTSFTLNLALLGGAEDTLLERLGDDLAVKRPSGFFLHPNLLGVYIAVTFPLALGILMFRSRFINVFLTLSILALVGMALVLTLSRTSWLGTGIAAIVLMFILLKKQIITMATCVKGAFVLFPLAIVITALKGETIYLRLTDSVVGNVLVRFELMEVAQSMIYDNFFLGVGLNNFIEVMRDYDKLAVFTGGFQHPVHNIYLLEFSETGLLGVLFFTFFLFGLFKMGSLALKQKNRRYVYLAGALNASFFAYFVMAMADWSYRFPQMTIIFWTNLGILGSLYLLRKDNINENNFYIS